MNWQGYDVLPIEPSRDGTISETSTREFSVVESDSGLDEVVGFWDQPRPVRPITWVAHGDEAIAELNDFIEARRGRIVPFWLPSFQADLTLAQNLTQGSRFPVFLSIGYTSRLFVGSGYRRHLGFIAPGIPFEFHRVTAASDNGSTETLTIVPPAQRLWTPDASVVCFLKLCRLEDDAASIDYLSRGVARAVITCREIPAEAPT